MNRYLGIINKVTNRDPQKEECSPNIHNVKINNISNITNLTSSDCKNTYLRPYDPTTFYDLYTDEGLNSPPSVKAGPKGKRAKSKNRVTKSRQNLPSHEDYLNADAALAETYNLVYAGSHVERVKDWLATLDGVSLDIETYGTARTKENHKKKPYRSSKAA